MSDATLGHVQPPGVLVLSARESITRRAACRDWEFAQTQSKTLFAIWPHHLPLSRVALLVTCDHDYISSVAVMRTGPVSNAGVVSLTRA